MPKSLFEHKKIGLKVKVTTNPKHVRSVKFKTVFVEEHQQLVSEEIKGSYKNTSGIATASFEPPNVPVGMDSYVLKFEAIVQNRGNTETIDVKGSYRIWPATGKITLTSANNKDHKKARFVIKTKQKKSTKAAKPSGIWTGDLFLGKLEVEAIPPFEFVDPQPQQGRERNYVVKKNAYQAEFITPHTEQEGAIKQYVNLKAKEAWSDAKPHGSEIVFVVGGLGDTERSKKERLAQPKDYIYIKVEFSELTPRAEPKRILKPTNKGSAAASNGNKTFKGKVELDGDGRGTFTVVLGYAGGEKVKVSIGTTNAASDASMEFVSWRKTYYELMYPDFMRPDMTVHPQHGYDLNANIKNVVNQRLAPTFVEYELSKAIPFSAGDAGAAVLTSEQLGVLGRQRMVYGGDLNSFPKAFTGGDKQRIGILLADLTLGERNKAATAICKQQTKASKWFGVGGGAIATIKLKGNKGKWKAIVANPQQYKDKQSGQYTHPGLDPDTGAPLSGEIDKACFSVETYKRVRVTLPSTNATDPGTLAGKQNGAKCPIEIKFGIYTCGLVNGCKASDGRQIMRLQPGKPPAPIASTVCHELAHSMGMTIVATRSKEPKGTPKAEHVDAGGNYYCEDLEDGQGLRALGRGPHCAEGVGDKTLRDFGGDKGSCIMFHCGSMQDNRPNFCPTCTDYIRARKLVDLHSEWTHRKAADY